MGRDLQRLARYYQLPLKLPSVRNAYNNAHLIHLLLLLLQDFADVMFNKGSLKAQRLLVAVKSACPEKLEDVSRQLSLRVWSRVCTCVYMCMYVMCALHIFFVF